MSRSSSPVTFVIPGDLHLTDPGLQNHRTAEWMVGEVNNLIRPDFVQFIGDNVQHAIDLQFHLFLKLCRQLQVPWSALVGDHDVDRARGLDPFREFVGDPCGVSSLGGFRLIRLNTLELPPLGLSSSQLNWFIGELAAARRAQEQAIVFQHHYPFKVFESYSGPGIDELRAIVFERPVAAIFCGHTHYAQVVNDGRNVAVATRSIGDPEGGPPGYSIVHCDGNELALTYRTIEDSGPVLLITHPRDLILATSPLHIVTGTDTIRARVWSSDPVESVMGRIDGGPWLGLELVRGDEWEFPLVMERIQKGGHVLEVEVRLCNGGRARNQITFLVDPTKRYTPVPHAHPIVKETAFC